MGPSATRIARARDAANAGMRTPPASDALAPSRTAPGIEPSVGGIDDLAKRYRRAAEKPAGNEVGDVAGPASGRRKLDDAERVARARAEAAKLAGDKSSGGDDQADRREPTLREKAYANPTRTRHHLAGQAGNGGPYAPGSGNAGSPLGPGAWPSGAVNVGYGCWDDDWSGWISWCHQGGDPWYWHGNQWYWHANYWGYWPWWSPTCWWWSAFWYPVFWYGSYSPSHVIVYEDATPTTVIVESAPAYPVPAEPAQDGLGEAVLDEDADPNARAAGAGVDESMERLLSPNAVSASRAATQNLSQGDAAFREGRFGDAVHYYAKAIEFQPDQGVLYLVLSDALFATGDYHYGAYALRKALELDATLVDEPVDKHGFYSDAREFDRQLAVLETYLKDRPTDSDARLLLAANYLFGARPAAAVDLLEEPASESLRASPAGKLLLASAQKQQYGAASQR